MKNYVQKTVVCAVTALLALSISLVEAQSQGKRLNRSGVRDDVGLLEKERRWVSER